jgi:O-antigen ligase
MLRVRSIGSVLGLLLLAFLQALGASFLTNRFGGTVAVALIVFVPLLFLGLPLVVSQAAGELSVIRKQLSWWHGLCVLIFASGMIFRVRETQALRDSPLDFWAAYRVALVAVVALVLLVRLALGKTPWLNALFRGLIGALAMYCLVCVASALWSIYPAWTLYKSLEYSVDVMLIAAILTYATTENLKAVFDWWWLLLGVIVVVIWIEAAIWPQDALVRGIGLLGVQLNGVLPTVSANGVGELAALLGVVAFCRLQFTSHRALYSLFLAVDLITLAFSQTRSAIIGFLLGIVLVLFFSRRLGSTAFLVLITVLLFSTTSAAETFWTYFLRGQNEGNFRTLTGRVGWWQTGWEQFLERPLTGYGAFAGGRFATLAKLGDTTTSTLHNTYLEILIGTSIWGLTPIVTVLLGTWAMLVRSFRYAWPTHLERQLAVEAIAVLGVITVRTFFSSGLVGHPDLGFLTVVAYAELLRRRLAAGAQKHTRLVWRMSPARL